MARMTKAQLVDENIALRHNLEQLRIKLHNAERDIAELRAQRTAPSAKRVAFEERIVGRYTKADGTHMVVVQTGWNTRAHRVAA